MPVLLQKGTGKPVVVPDESVQFWVDRGYRLQAVPKPEPEPKPAPTRRRASKK